MKILTLLLITFLLTSCDVSNKKELKGSIERTGLPITTTVYFYESVEDVQRKYREIHKLSKDQKIGQVGFARWPEFRDAQGQPVDDPSQPLTCEIHTVRPKKIDDSDTLTLGHEMLHCIIGTYHPEN
jgi:hypothetical protein